MVEFLEEELELLDILVFVGRQDAKGKEVKDAGEEAYVGRRGLSCDQVLEGLQYVLS